ncbi:MAG: ABC transporter permease [Ilumatobacteraceae bacterium]
MSAAATPAVTTAAMDEHRPSVWRAALRMGRTRVGIVLTLLLAGVALVGPYVAPFGPTDFVDMPSTRDVPGTLLGTDYFGQDVWSRFLHGGRQILLLALVATALGLVLGASLGMYAAYRRGRADEAIMRSLDVILSFPQVLLSLVVIAMFGPSSWLIVLTVALSTTPRAARIIRGAAISVVERDFVLAADALGESRPRIVVAEILPNVTAALLVEANLRLTYAIGLIASLAFLGFTPNPNAANWGLMVQENRLSLAEQPWGTLLPTLAIALLTIGTGLIGDGLSRAAAGIDRGRAQD